MEPPNQLESTTVWSFPKRGDWATHESSYRGNWAPQVPRNLILRYTNEGGSVLDPMMGSGTTLIECKILNRRGCGFDINPEAVALVQSKLNFALSFEQKISATLGDARKLRDIRDNSFDLVALHPPYLDIIKYSRGCIEGDLSNHNSVEKFKEDLGLVARECFRVLRRGGFCAVLIGDTRRSGSYIPLAFEVLGLFLGVGFLLKEDVIKLQHNCHSTSRWADIAIKRNFLLIMHEHLLIFKKPSSQISWSVEMGDCRIDRFDGKTLIK